MSEKKKRPTRAELRQKPVEFTPRYHTNETLKPCPDCELEIDGETCGTCGGVGLVYVTGEQSTENDASQT
ncbi:MAG TPA: hypothetical protein VGI10_06210 [Polyangiaceae bacterium]|jgi:hypothetical protein